MTEGYHALRQGAAWLDLDSRGRIVARGRDRARLLHNITSNEVKKDGPRRQLLRLPAQLRRDAFRPICTCSAWPTISSSTPIPACARKSRNLHPPLYHRRPGGARGRQRADRLDRRRRPVGGGGQTRIRRPHRRANHRYWPARLPHLLPRGEQSGNRLAARIAGRPGRPRPTMPAWSASKTASRSTAKISAIPRCRRKPGSCRPSASTKDATWDRKSWSASARWAG